MSLPYAEQCRLKEMQVKKLLDGVLADRQPDYLWEGIKQSPSVYEYRNKMEFSFGDEVKDGSLALGMHKRGSFYDIVTVEDCRLVDEDYRNILKAVLSFFAGRQISFFHRLTHEGFLRHLLVRSEPVKFLWHLSRPRRILTTLQKRRRCWRISAECCGRFRWRESSQGYCTW